MKLSELLEGVAYQTTIGDYTVSEVSCDSRRITPDSVFVCIKGENFDGHDHALNALGKGAVAVVCERDLGLKSQVIVENTRLVYAKMCARLFGDPAKRLRLIGVTGTNGKTTVTNLIKGILTEEGKTCGLIGTIQNEIGDRVIGTTHTTPDAYELQSLFDSMVHEGCTHAVMEVSSHALAQERLGDTVFDTAVFTNLSQDHLDYHKTMEAYFAAKKKLFEMTKSAVVNLDDPYGRRLIEETGCRDVTTYSIADPSADLFGEDVRCTTSGVTFTLSYQGEKATVTFGMPGLYSAQNALAAAGACLKAGISFAAVTAGLAQSHGVRGRSEIIPAGQDYMVICDYAHTPEGLNNILPSVRGFVKGRLIVLFGCGGDRDKLKRPLMGAAAAKNADFLVVTSDNPRTEDPHAIIADILPGVKQYHTPYVAIDDRVEAIHYALDMAKAGDVIVLAGKGHEDYQVVGQEKHHMDEREIVLDYVNAKKA